MTSWIGSYIMRMDCYSLPTLGATLKKFWYYLPLFVVLTGIFSALQAPLWSQKIFMMALLIVGLMLIVQVSNYKRALGRREPWFDYYFPVIFAIMVSIISWVWKSAGEMPLALFCMIGVLVGKLTMLATYYEFRYPHLILYGLFLQMTWEFSFGMRWIPLRPLIHVFV